MMRKIYEILKFLMIFKVLPLVKGIEPHEHQLISIFPTFSHFPFLSHAEQLINYGNIT